MPVDLRCKHDREVRARAADLFAAGRGRGSVARELSVPEAEVMAEHGVASASPLDSWCRAYREGGEEALRPRPKGRPRGSGAKAAPRTREQELEERVRRLEAEVAYLKKLRALRGM